MAGYDLKSEEDVKLFLKNLHTEYTFGCFSEKKPEICHLLGDYYEAISRDFVKAADIYKKNCENLNYGRSCAKYGGYAVVGKGCEKNLLEAFKKMKRGCELGDEIGCTNAGIMSITNPEVQGSNRKEVILDGIKMLNTACMDHKTDKACFFLAGVHLRGIENVAEKNLVEAYKCSLKACEFGNPYACANVAQMHERGEGAQKNPHMAEIFKKRAVMLEKEIKEAQQTLQFGQGIKV